MPSDRVQIALFAVLALCGYANNMHAYIMCNTFRISGPKVIGIFAVTGALLVPIHWIMIRLNMDRVTLPPHQLIVMAAVLLISTGSAANRAYFLSMTALFSNFISIAASYAAECAVGYLTPAYFIAYPAITLLMMAMYSVAVHRYGALLRTRIVSGISPIALGLFALIALVSWQFQQRLYISRANLALPLPINPETAHAVLPFFLTGSIVALSATFFFVQLRARDRLEIRLAQSALAAGRNYYGKLTQMSDGIRALRHDYQYHLTVLDNLLQAGETERAQHHLNELARANEGAEDRQYCASQLLNALLNEHEAQCAAAGIAFDVSVEPRDTGLSAEYELCIILGNLLEYAIAASRSAPGGRRIALGLSVREAGCRIDLRASRDAAAKAPDTRATLEAVRSIVARHGGECALTRTDSDVCASVTLPIRGVASA